MLSFLDSMKEYVDKARQRAALAEDAYRTAASEFQAASNDLTIWSNAYALALKERERWQAEARETQTQLPMELPDAGENARQPPSIPVEQPRTEEINKAAKVREILAARGGITPAELWMEVKDFNMTRPYLYSVLKRLRDNNEVAVRKNGKYMLKPRAAEGKSEEMETEMIQ